MKIFNLYTFPTVIRAYFPNFSYPYIFSEEDEGAEIEEPIEELADLTLEEETTAEGNSTTVEEDESKYPKGSN